MEERKVFSFSRKIGYTLYNVNVYQVPIGKETFEEKLRKLIRNEMEMYFLDRIHGFHRSEQKKMDLKKEE